MLKGINWIAVLVAIVAVQALGYLWYGMAFSARWMAEMDAVGLTVDTSAGNQTASMIQGILITVVMVIGLAWLMGRLGATGLMGGVTTGLAAWFFFSLTTQALEYVYMGFTPTLMAINVGYQLLAFVVGGAVLGTVKFGRSAAAAAA